MISKSLITAIILCLLPAATAFGQVLRREKELKGSGTTGSTGTYAVFYASGLAESAIWPLGMNLMANKATIRHTQSTGNGNNIPVNDRVPFRFIIAPRDGAATATWAAAMGINQSANDDLAEVAPGTTSGCATFGTSEFPSGWRMPTQREMMLMWLFRTGINATYTSGSLTQSDYWTATEANELDAWFMSVSDTNPQMKTGLKSSSTQKYRCVRDY